jgi:hypothetical protein
MGSSELIVILQATGLSERERHTETQRHRDRDRDRKSCVVSNAVAKSFPYSLIHNAGKEKHKRAQRDIQLCFAARSGRQVQALCGAAKRQA